MRSPFFFMSLTSSAAAQTVVSVRRLPGAEQIDGMSTRQLRGGFLVSDLFEPSELRICCTDMDRLVVGGIVPLRPVALPPCSEFGTSYFTERREIGIANIGAPGLIRTTSQVFRLDHMSFAYIGAGEEQVVFEAEGSGQPVFYFVSCPAHHRHPSTFIPRTCGYTEGCGDQSRASRRRITRCIHPHGVASCQLVMGFTELERGSVWNTMPPHTHSRRSEVYLYTGLGDNIAVHLMGEPDATRNLIVRNNEAVLSPSWSIHTAAGTGHYSFIWAMAGENQSFNDMDPITLDKLY
jgi:4-deoxy-L-threo-5-hexosulose-uronate ketol-isomerase